MMGGREMMLEMPAVARSSFWDRCSGGFTWLWGGKEEAGGALECRSVSRAVGGALCCALFLGPHTLPCRAGGPSISRSLPHLPQTVALTAF